MAHAKLEIETSSTGDRNIELTRNRLRALRAKFKQNPLPMSSGMVVAEQEKYVTWKVDPRKFDTLELLHLTDVQFGHILCNEKKMIEYRDWVLAEPNRFMLWGGDEIDAGTRLSVGSPWEQLCEPQGQIYRFCEIWAEARHRIVGYVGGNHERRGIPTFGDLGTLIASILEIPYSAGRQFVDIAYGRHESFRVDLWHGKGAAQTAGSKMQMLHRFMQSGDAQLYLVGHLHDCLFKLDWRILRQPGRNKVKAIKIAGAMSSSFLEYFGSYAEVAGMTVSGLAMWRCILEPSGRWELTIR